MKNFARKELLEQEKKSHFTIKIEGFLLIHFFIICWTWNFPEFNYVERLRLNFSGWIHGNIHQFINFCIEPTHSECTKRD